MFSSRSALVTGGASGIGQAIAASLLQQGANVCIFDRNPIALPASDRLLAVCGDVSREEDVQRAVACTAERFGAINILVNNAGIEVEGRVENLSAAEWDRQMAVNLRGAFLFAKYVIAHMKSAGGSIVNISSIDAFVGYPGLVAYDSSKGALLAFTRSLAVECGPERIRVNAVCPGYIETPLLDAYFNRQPDPAAARLEAASRHPVSRLGQPQDVAEAVLFLLSDRAAFITGTALIVDGGLTAAGP
jgi:meso-butanediol dehydrogenase / (S,S)-butanediol dehydrogenase / diacetyl reductase